MSIQNIAIQRAIALLNASGAEYIIRPKEGDDIVRGSLQLYVPPVVPERKRIQRVPMGFYKAIYDPMVANMQPGDVWSYVCPPEIDIDGLRSAVSSELNKHFGNGNGMTTIDKKTRKVEALRVA